MLLCREIMWIKIWVKANYLNCLYMSLHRTMGWGRPVGKCPDDSDDASTQEQLRKSDSSHQSRQLSALRRVLGPGENPIVSQSAHPEEHWNQVVSLLSHSRLGRSMWKGLLSFFPVWVFLSILRVRLCFKALTTEWQHSMQSCSRT